MLEAARPPRVATGVVTCIGGCGVVSLAFMGSVDLEVLHDSLDAVCDVDTAEEYLVDDGGDEFLVRVGLQLVQSERALALYLQSVRTVIHQLQGRLQVAPVQLHTALHNTQLPLTQTANTTFLSIPSPLLLLNKESAQLSSRFLFDVCFYRWNSLLNFELRQLWNYYTDERIHVSLLLI